MKSCASWAVGDGGALLSGVLFVCAGAVTLVHQRGAAALVPGCPVPVGPSRRGCGSTRRRGSAAAVVDGACANANGNTPLVAVLRIGTAGDRQARRKCRGCWAQPDLDQEVLDYDGRGPEQVVRQGQLQGACYVERCCAVGWCLVREQRPMHANNAIPYFDLELSSFALPKRGSLY